MKCDNKKCENEATIQFDHVGKLMHYCENDWQRYKTIMNAMGSPVPTAYPVGTVSK